MSHDHIGAAARRSELDVLKAQVQALEAWNRAQRLSEPLGEAVSITREMRLDLARRMEARRREHDALIARADAQLRASGDVLASAMAPRAVLAHRNAWLRDKVAARLADRGVVVVGAFEDGADAAGTIVIEQPDLVLVEDRLPTVTGIDVVRRAQTYAPSAFVAAHVMDSADIEAMVEAGADAVFTRRIPPLEIADELLACLGGDRGLVVA